MSRSANLILLPVLIGLIRCGSVLACPFCDATSQTLSEEIAAADVSVVARLVSLPPEVDPNSSAPTSVNLDDLDNANSDSGTAEFEVLDIVRSADGATVPDKGDKIRVVYFGSKADNLDRRFLVSGIGGSKIDWTTPLPLTERGIEYIKQLQTLPEKGADRLTFFLGHLEDEDPLLAQDAYDEFARASYEAVIAIADKMDRPELLRWIQDAEVGPTRRRLYLTMLGVCGKPEDVAVLESLINYDYHQMKPGVASMLAMMSQWGPALGAPVVGEMLHADVRRKQQCLDALIAAYLKLKGPDGLPMIEERFLTNPDAEYTHVYATIMSLRFHGEETDVLPKERLLQSVRLLLDNEEIADQVIPDLARWEDWSVMDRLVSMFKNSDNDAWVRQPVISYLIAASDQTGDVKADAEAALAELEQLDPEGVKRARSYMAFGLLARAGSKKGDAAAKKTSDEKAKPQPQTNPGNVAKTAPAEPEASPEPIATNPIADDTTAETEQAGPSRMMLIGAPVISGVVLFGVFALLLRGADVRSTNRGSQNPND